MQITRSSIATGRGPAEWFTGDVYVDTITSPTAPSRLQAASVCQGRPPGRRGIPTVG